MAEVIDHLIEAVNRPWREPAARTNGTAVPDRAD